MAFPGLFFAHFRSFQATTILHQVNVKNTHLGNLRFRDSSSCPLDHESATITTRPLPPPMRFHVIALEYQLQRRTGNSHVCGLK